MNKLLDSLKEETNYGLTQNGAVKHLSTLNKVLDMFAFGGAYRNRSEVDCIHLFKEAFEEDPELALKCLFYLRDCRGGQGERRFFRVCLKWLANNYPEVVKLNIENVSLFGRWDDLFVLNETRCRKEMIDFIKSQLVLDVNSKTPSLLGKWMPSEQASSYKTKQLAEEFRLALGMTNRTYRKMLSELRSRINIVEKLMSEGKWNDIEFDKIPSKAGLKYKNAFARHDIIKEKYRSFVTKNETSFNTNVLYPYEIVREALKARYYALDDTERIAVNKYWSDMKDWTEGRESSALCVVDTSGSMTWGNKNGVLPIDVAISLGIYFGERAKGPFQNHYVSFSRDARLIEINGVDFIDKVKRIYDTNICEDTNIKSVFDLLLNTALKNKLPQSELPERIIVISDMEFNDANYDCYSCGELRTLMENIAVKWQEHGYRLPDLIYWNVDAKSDNIPDLRPGISFVSGCSPSIFTTIMTGKTGMELMMEILNKERYSVVRIK